MAHINKGSHIFTCYPHIYRQITNESCLSFCSPATTHYHTSAGTHFPSSWGTMHKPLCDICTKSYCV